MKLSTKAVLHRLAWGDVVPFDLGLLAPFEDGHAGHLRAVVRDNGPRFSAFGDETTQLAGKPCPRQGCIGDQAQAFTGEVVDHRQNTEPRPSVKASLTKSRLQRSLGREGRARGRLVPKARFLPPRLRTVSFSSR